MTETGMLPSWVVPPPCSVRDLSCLSLRMLVEEKGTERARTAAGMVAVLGWLRGAVRGPMTGRTDGPARRDVALCELCAAECRVDDGHPPPPLHEVCQLAEVAYRPPRDVDAGYARGVWLALRWALGQMARPPLDLPIRRPDGQLMGEVEVYAQLLAGADSPPDPALRAELRRTAAALVTDSRHLAGLVDDAAARIRA